MLLSEVDFFAGTSTGAILAAALAIGHPPADIRSPYEKHGHHIFDRTRADRFVNPWDAFFAHFATEPRLESLTEVFGDMRLADIASKILIASFDLDAVHDKTPEGIGTRSWKAKFFHNFAGADSDGDERVVDVLMRSSAGPTFFPIYQNFVDGGIVANNPAMCAVAQAVDETRGGFALGEIHLLSIGTGFNPMFIPSDDGNWGLLPWWTKPIYMMLDGASGVAHYQCRQILGQRYQRLDALLGEPVGLDAVDQIPYLENLADHVDVEAAAKFLANGWST